MDLSIFLDFVATLNNDENLNDSNLGTHDKHVLDSNIEICDEDVIEDSDINDYDEFILGKECEKAFSNEFNLPPQDKGMEVKVLPSHLKYVFLGDKNTLSVITSRKLTEEQEEKLLETLKKNKQVIEWMLDDLKGIDPSFCTHRIDLKEGAKDKVSPIHVVPKKLDMTIMENNKGQEEIGQVYTPGN
ncbi:uncharacterized protein E5676_scaffold154G00300 [Cucumis melo var. makuwa]|uniref:Uncharacterized protein n=1 Tax=Cucumis melo var. makuwa TaxID=1194695 RepID=A0A5D3D615_CUCMM|nr:uncharacterized protein E6C27_scaffold36G001060 [Cucumis melo var. makuwa]TYK19004.1 uncharacterized protein E5676_scaffold154G00300 [Cucumis melo var. makuwa]